MKKLLAFILTISTFHAIGQTTYFQTSYGDVFIDDAQSITSTFDNGYCLVGGSGPNQLDSTDVTVYRLNQFGSLLWSKKIGDPKDEFATDIKETSDNGFIVVGNSYASPLDTLYSDAFAMKLDDQGFTSWTQTYGGSDQDEVQSVVITSDGGFILFGSTMSYGSVFKSAMAIKIDANGVQQWTKIYSMTTANYFYRAHRTLDGNIIAVGGTYNANGGTNFDHYVVKMAENGTVIWAKRYGTAGADWSYDVAEANDGFIIAGVSSTNTAGSADQNIFKIDQNGTLMWTNNYGTLKYDRPSTLLLDANQNIFVCGFSDISSTTNTVNQMTLHKIDFLGNTVWSKTYGDPTGTSEGLYMIRGTDGGYIMCGYSITFSDPYGDAYVVKTDPNGVSGCYQSVINFTKNATQFVDSSGSNVTSIMVDEFPISPPADYYVNQFTLNCFYDQVDVLNGENSVSLYPNPAQSVLTIEQLSTASMQINIYDLAGRKTKKFQTTTLKTVVDISDLSPGVYMVSIENATSRSVKKLIIR